MSQTFEVVKRGKGTSSIGLASAELAQIWRAIQGRRATQADANREVEILSYFPKRKPQLFKMTWDQLRRDSNRSETVPRASLRNRKIERLDEVRALKK